MKNAASRPGHGTILFGNTTMPHDDSYLRHQRQRWLRPDAHL
jgi:hypothetical protein